MTYDQIHPHFVPWYLSIPTPNTVPADVHNLFVLILWTLLVCWLFVAIYRWGASMVLLHGIRRSQPQILPNLGYLSQALRMLLRPHADSLTARQSPIEGVDLPHIHMPHQVKRVSVSGRPAEPLLAQGEAEDAAGLDPSDSGMMLVVHGVSGAGESLPQLEVLWGADIAAVHTLLFQGQDTLRCPRDHPEVVLGDEPDHRCAGSRSHAPSPAAGETAGAEEFDGPDQEASAAQTSTVMRRWCASLPIPRGVFLRATGTVGPEQPGKQPGAGKTLLHPRPLLALVVASDSDAVGGDRAGDDAACERPPQLASGGGAVRAVAYSELVLGSILASGRAEGGGGVGGEEAAAVAERAVDLAIASASIEVARDGGEQSGEDEDEDKDEDEATLGATAASPAAEPAAADRASARTALPADTGSLQLRLDCEGVVTLPNLWSVVVKPLFGAPPPELRHLAAGNEHEDLDPEAACAVCMMEPRSVGLLPCRHVCVCRRCFGHLDGKCPVCRTPFVEYVLLRDGEANEGDAEGGKEEEEAVGQGRGAAMLD